MFKVGDIVTCQTFGHRHCTITHVREHERCTVACHIPNSSIGWLITKFDIEFDTKYIGYRGWNLKFNNLTLIKKATPIWLPLKDKE